MWNWETEAPPLSRFERWIITLTLLALAVLMVWKGLNLPESAPETAKTPAYSVTVTPAPDMKETHSLVLRGEELR